MNVSGDSMPASIRVFEERRISFGELLQYYDMSEQQLILLKSVNRGNLA
jgi:hypothetical protein